LSPAAKSSFRKSRLEKSKEPENTNRSHSLNAREAKVT
jgi:hypothetical protein